MNEIVKTDSWDALRQYTQARIALGRAGSTKPLRGELAFRLAHAHARDAVHSILDLLPLLQFISNSGLPALQLRSQAADRAVYLQRPDLGRLLQKVSEKIIADHHATNDLVIIIADGLSATAINHNMRPLLEALLPLVHEQQLTLAPVCIAEQARVAIGDPIGAGLGSKVSVLLIGERPGLTAADSIGAYITYQPRPGLTDESRNCVSNIRPGGLSFAAAAAKIMYLVSSSIKINYSGVRLKDNTTGDDQPMIREPV